MNEAPIAVTTHSGFKLNDEQEVALASMLEWATGPESYFVLSGFAGTGKTFTCKALTTMLKGRIVYTAPTNKAVKVLRATLTTDTYRPDCSTIYSLLGLRMMANGEVKELVGRDKEGDDVITIGTCKFIIVDEGSMVNIVLMKEIAEAIAEFPQLKFLFMGDPAQLPPVGEVSSPIWKLDCPKATLIKVMRHDNQILNLVTSIREVVDHYNPKISLKGDHDAAGGVWLLRDGDFAEKIKQRAEVGAFHDGYSTKVVAWRNVMVDKYNKLIRAVYFEDANLPPWILDDRVIFTGPAKDLDDKPMVRTDDEGVITSLTTCYHPVYGDFKVWRMGITLDDNRLVTAFVLHGDSLKAFAEEKDRLGATKQWKAFWELIETFHGLRHAYAVTAHRAQGSTYKTVFVDYKDILLNRNRQEAYRCLYVACSRPTTNLILG